MPPHLRAQGGDHSQTHIDPSLAGSILRLNEDDRRFLLSRKPPPFLATLRNVQAKFLANELKREEHLKAAQVLSGGAPVAIRKRKRPTVDDSSVQAPMTSNRGEAGTRRMERMMVVDDEGDNDEATQLALSQSSQSTLGDSQLTSYAGFASAAHRTRYAARPPFSS